MGMINLNVIIPVLVIQLIIMVIALVDLAKIENTRGPKLLWVVIILFFSILGSVAYFIFGRRNS